jgi:hypothetical protein
MRQSSQAFTVSKYNTTDRTLTRFWPGIDHVLPQTMTTKQRNRMVSLARLALGAEFVGSEHECKVACTRLAELAVRDSWSTTDLWAFLDMDTSYQAMTWAFVVDAWFEAQA